MKATEKQEARRLRKAGLSIKEICRQLKVAKSSVSLWVRDIELTSEQIANLESRIASSRRRFAYLSRCAGANTNRLDAEQRHQHFKETGRARARKDEEFPLICALYWGEGTKSIRRNSFEIANSDPGLLSIIVTWLVRNGYGDLIGFVVRYHGDNGMSVEDIKDWWLDRIPLLERRHFRTFKKCIVNRASQRKHVGKLPYGTGSVQVCRTELLCQVLGGIDYLRDSGDW